MKVAVGVIFDQQQRVLITQRSLNAIHGGLWEFPGGKLEAGELPSQALIREINEEIGIDILEYRFLGEISHCYGAKTITLLVFTILNYKGNPVCRESQLALHWVTMDNLSNYNFPEANMRIIELLKMDCKQEAILS